MLQSIWQISTTKLSQQQDSDNSCGENDWSPQFNNSTKLLTWCSEYSSICKDMMSVSFFWLWNRIHWNKLFWVCSFSKITSLVLFLPYQVKGPYSSQIAVWIQLKCPSCGALPSCTLLRYQAFKWIEAEIKWYQLRKQSVRQGEIPIYCLSDEE